jgi:hypothetical protein
MAHFAGFDVVFFLRHISDAAIATCTRQALSSHPPLLQSCFAKASPNIRTLNLAEINSP